MKNMIKLIKGEASFVTYVKKRLKLNLNFIGLFSGSTGIGKTYSGLSFAEQLDKNFDADKQIVFDFEEMMNLINQDWFKKKKIKVVLWDEPQISISNRAWQSQLNKLVNYLLSTFRHQNIVLIWCSPYKDFLDSQSMKLLHCEFQCLGWNKKTGLSRIKPRFLQYNQDLKRFYPHPLMVINENNKLRPLFFWDIKKPNDKDIEIYERRKTNFTSKLNKEIQDTLEGMKPKVQELPKPTIALTPLQENILECISNGIEKQKDIAEKLGTRQDIVSKAIISLRKKGFSIRKMGFSTKFDQIRQISPIETTNLYSKRAENAPTHSIVKEVE